VPVPVPVTAAAAPTEEVTEVDLTIVVDDATDFSKDKFTSSLAEAAEAEADQMEVTGVEFRVDAKYRFPASMAEETAQRGLVRASGRPSSQVSVKRRPRGGGRRLAAIMDMFDANYTADTAGSVSTLAGKANDTSLITAAMVLEGAENFTMEVVDKPTKKN